MNIITDINHNNGKSTNVVLENSAISVVKPDKPIEGARYFNTSNGFNYIYRNSAWTPEKVDYANKAGTADSATKALSADKLTTGRYIGITGGVIGNSVLFNGAGNVTFNATRLNESFLQYDSVNDFSGSYGPIDASLIPALGANRFYGGKEEGITIEVSHDNGTTWIERPKKDIKSLFIPDNYHYFRIGSPDKDLDSKYVTQLTDQTRVIIDTSKFKCYTTLNKFLIYVSVGIGLYVDIDKALEATPDAYEVVKHDVRIAGWSGYNIINVPRFTTYGNTPNIQYGRIRFTFKVKELTDPKYFGPIINTIMGFGGVGWETPTYVSQKGVPYNTDGESIMLNSVGRIYNLKSPIDPTEPVSKDYGDRIYFPKTGGRITGQTIIEGTALQANLQTRGISGCTENGSTKGDLFLNYDGNENYVRKVYLSGTNVGAVAVRQDMLDIALNGIRQYVDTKIADIQPTSSSDIPTMDILPRGYYDTYYYQYKYIYDPFLRFKLHPTARTKTEDLSLQLLRYVNRGQKKYQVVKEFTWSELNAVTEPDSTITINGGLSSLLLATVWCVSPETAGIPAKFKFQYGKVLTEDIQNSFLVCAHKLYPHKIYKVFRHRDEAIRDNNLGFSPGMLSANFAARLLNKATGEVGPLLYFNLCLKKDNRKDREDVCFITARTLFPGIYRKG